MLKKIFFLLLIVCSINTVIAKPATLGNTYVTVTNNTNETMIIQSTLNTADSHFKRGKDWNGISATLIPYETKQVLWFSRNQDVKGGKTYQFDLIASHPNTPGRNVIVRFNEKGKSVYGSDINTELVFPDEPNQPILKHNGLQSVSGNFWGSAYTVYGRTWLPLGNAFNNYHIVIDKPENNSFDTSSNKTISVLTYNVQLMPFYANVVDHLNQPDIRQKDIPSKIASYDVVILEELFDGSLRKAISEKMQAYYPYHTSVVGHGTSKVLTGGVMIFSKWPIIKEDQITYQAASRIDELAAKGAMYAAINKNGKIYHIFGTHMQAGDWTTRQKQLQELANFADRLMIPVDEPILMGGDFNVSAIDNNNFPVLLDYLHLNAVDNIGYYYSCDGLINTMAASSGRGRPDYVFYNNLHLKPRSAINKIFILRDLGNEKMWPNFDLSDHFPTVGYFDFS